jgi:hypothetical protein
LASSKRIKIESSSNIQADHFYQKIVNHDTGTAQIVNRQGPSRWTKENVVLGDWRDPEHYKSETKSQGDAPVKEVKVENKLADPREELDTSQL